MALAMERFLPAAPPGHANQTQEKKVELHSFEASRSISRLAKRGNVADARAVFDRMPRRSLDTAVWNALMLAYASNGQGEVALELFGQMDPCEPDARSFVAVLKACVAIASKDPGKDLQSNGITVKARALETGMALHARAARSSFDCDKFVSNVLIDMYARCGSIVDAARVFFRMNAPDVVSWTSLILGHADGEAGLELFERMVAEGSTAADSRGFVAGIKACTKIETRRKLGGGGSGGRSGVAKVALLERGFALHALAAKNDLDRDTFVATSLCDMYANFGSMEDAAALFWNMSRRDVVAWNAMILGYAENGQGRRAVELFSAMAAERLKPSDRTFVAAFKACSSMAADEDGSEIDGKTVKVEALEAGMAIHAFGAAARDDVFVTTSLLDMYTKCNSMVDARRVFDNMRVHALATWNSLLLGYAESGENEMALELLEGMIVQEKLSPDARTFGAALKASAGTAALHLGKALHSWICRSGALDHNASLAGCLVDFYSRCGSITEARLVFETIERNDTVTWSALLAGLSRQGSLELVLTYFEAMLEEGVPPDDITFLSVLAACGHGGLVDQGMKYFRAMISSYGLEPGMEHYHCIVDMLGRGNQLDEAVKVVESMPLKPTALTWTTVLANCCRWKNLALGKRAFNSLLELDDKAEVGYVLMANIYGSLEMWDARQEVYDALSRKKAESTTL